jgi:hypothetical protein
MTRAAEPMKPNSSVARRHIVITGRVQGVGYRSWLGRNARTAGLVGEVAIATTDASWRFCRELFRGSIRSSVADSFLAILTMTSLPQGFVDPARFILRPDITCGQSVTPRCSWSSCGGAASSQVTAESIRIGRSVSRRTEQIRSSSHHPKVGGSDPPKIPS